MSGYDDLFISGAPRPVEIDLPAGKRTIYLREIGFADAVAFADARKSPTADARASAVATIIAQTWVTDQGVPVTSPEAARMLKPEAANAIVAAIFGFGDDAGEPDAPGNG